MGVHCAERRGVPRNTSACVSAAVERIDHDDYFITKITWVCRNVTSCSAFFAQDTTTKSAKRLEHSVVNRNIGSVLAAHRTRERPVGNGGRNCVGNARGVSEYGKNFFVGSGRIEGTTNVCFTLP
jgi:hypothetical protein